MSFMRSAPIHLEKSVTRLIFGNFAWNDKLRKTFAENLNIEYEYRFEETENGKWINIDAWLSNYDDSIHGEPCWENFLSSRHCDQEP